MSTPTLDAETLASVAQLVGQAKEAANWAALHASQAYHKGDKSIFPVYEQAKAAKVAAEQAGVTLARLGIHAPQTETAAGSPVGLDLNALRSMDTPDTRELLHLLEQAQAVAERIDASRNRVLPEHLPLQPGESRGVDLAESVSNIAVRVRREVHGGGAGRGE